MFTLDGIRRFHGWTHACLSLLLDHLASIPATDYGKVLPALILLCYKRRCRQQGHLGRDRARCVAICRRRVAMD
jgi:hypothetical protein